MHGLKLDPELGRQLGEEVARFAEGSATTHRLREDLISHASDRIEILSRKMLRRSSIVVRSNVQTGDVFVGAAMRLMRALKQVSPLDPRAFFGLVGLQIRRELVDLARHFRRDAQSYSFDEPEHERQRFDNPRNLECWTRFHDAVGRLPAEQREVVDLHWYQGLGQEEIASLLKVDKSTISAAGGPPASGWPRSCRIARRLCSAVPNLAVLHSIPTRNVSEDARPTSSLTLRASVSWSKRVR